MGGLKQGSDDYNWVYGKFFNQEQGYDVDNYDGDAIIRDPAMPHFRDKYDVKQFKQSLSRLVSKIRNDPGTSQIIYVIHHKE